jgi:hypothetical protein
VHKLSVSLSGLSRDVNANPRRLGGREALQDVMASVSLGVLLVLSTHVIKCTSGFNTAVAYCLPVGAHARSGRAAAAAAAAAA